MKITCTNIGELEKTDRVRLAKAIELIEQAVMSDEFEKRVLGMYYTYTTGWWRWKKWHRVNNFAWNNGLSREQILCALREDREFQWHVIPGSSSAIGYGYPGDKNVYTYEWFARGSSIEELAGHIFHEILHDKSKNFDGFDHPYRNSWIRPYTVPYWAGYEVERIAKKL